MQAERDYARLLLDYIFDDIRRVVQQVAPVAAVTSSLVANMQTLF